MKKNKRPEIIHRGNDIQIDYIKRYFDADNSCMDMSYYLKCINLDYNAPANFRWEGKMDNESVWVEFERLGYGIVFSENFPYHHKEAAEADVKRITKQFN